MNPQRTFGRASESIRNVSGEMYQRDPQYGVAAASLDAGRFGLVPALDWQARETAKRTGMHVQLNTDLTDELPEEHTTCIYRVVQEALNNCARHVQASTLQVAVRWETAKILLSVMDDESGFDPRRVGGMGLLGMEERVRHLGGTFEVDSEPGRGTRVEIVLPLASLNGEHRNGTNPHPSV